MPRTAQGLSQGPNLQGVVRGVSCARSPTTPSEGGHCLRENSQRGEESVTIVCQPNVSGEKYLCGGGAHSSPFGNWFSPHQAESQIPQFAGAPGVLPCVFLSCLRSSEADMPQRRCALPSLLVLLGCCAAPLLPPLHAQTAV